MRRPWTPRWQRCVPALTAGVLALVGCSGGGTDFPTATAPESAASTVPEVATPTWTPRPDPAPPPPPHACYRLSAEQAQRATNSSRATPCLQPHSAQTYHVGVIPSRVVEDRRDPDTTAIADFVTPRCDNHLVAHAGGSAETRILSRLQPAWFVPTLADLGRGSRWFRCDVIGFATEDRLSLLPRRSAGLLAQPASLDTYGLCSTAAPSRAGGDQVMCSRPHTWQAFSILRLEGRKSRLDARQECKTQARVHQGYPLRWAYGWQRPTRDQWQAGQRWGYCWTPDR